MHSRIGFSLFATAIAGSAVAHALVLATFSKVHVGSAHAPPDFAEMTVVYDAIPPERDPSEFDIGQRDAKGYATHDAAGHREQLAREAPQDQASLSLDPVGTLMRVDLPSMPGEGDHVVPTIAAPTPPAVAANASAPTPTGPRLPVAVENRVLRERVEGVMPEPPPTPAAPALQPIEVAIAAPTPAPRPVAPGSGADPAPQSDSESDAFSVLGSAQFRGGRVTVQSGRQVKTRRPRVGLAGMVELAQRSTAEVVLKVAVDSTGKVTNVDVARSSGSNDIDQPCRVAMYDWWFEPKKDPGGRAIPDVFQFTISFR